MYAIFRHQLKIGEKMGSGHFPEIAVHIYSVSIHESGFNATHYAVPCVKPAMHVTYIVNALCKL